MCERSSYYVSAGSHKPIFILIVTEFLADFKEKGKANLNSLSLSEWNLIKKLKLNIVGSTSFVLPMTSLFLLIEAQINNMLNQQCQYVEPTMLDNLTTALSYILTL